MAYRRGGVFSIQSTLLAAQLAEIGFNEESMSKESACAALKICLAQVIQLCKQKAASRASRPRTPQDDRSAISELFLFDKQAEKPRAFLKQYLDSGQASTSEKEELKTLLADFLSQKKAAIAEIQKMRTLNVALAEEAKRNTGEPILPGPAAPLTQQPAVNPVNYPNADVAGTNAMKR